MRGARTVAQAAEVNGLTVTYGRVFGVTLVVAHAAAGTDAAGASLLVAVLVLVRVVTEVSFATISDLGGVRSMTRTLPSAATETSRLFVLLAVNFVIIECLFSIGKVRVGHFFVPAALLIEILLVVVTAWVVVARRGPAAMRALRPRVALLGSWLAASLVITAGSFTVLFNTVHLLFEATQSRITSIGMLLTDFVHVVSLQVAA